MWQRSDLKEAAKEVLRRTYWMTVVVSLIFGIVGGGGGGGFGYRPSYRGSHNSSHSSSFNNQSPEELKQSLINDALSAAAAKGEITQEDFSNYYNTDDISELPQSVKDELKHKTDEARTRMSEEEKALILTLVTFGIVVFVVIFIVGMLLSALVFMPLQVGCYRYFVRVRSDEGKVDDVVFAFKDNYKNIVKVMFIRYLKVLGWTCLFIIPGIIKSYEYSMIPYLLAENPAMTSEEAFAATKKMMDGNKWDTFVLGLSFIGWVILGVLTCGIGLVFYVNPYKNLTFAELYHTLKELNGVDPFPQSFETAEEVL